MAAWKPAPARSIVACSLKPAPTSVSSMKAEKTLEMPIDATNAASGGRKPGVASSPRAVVRKSTSSSSGAASRAAADVLGGVGGGQSFVRFVETPD